jgi:hypothetical protein
MDKEEASVMLNWKKITILVVVLGIFIAAFILLSNKDKLGSGSTTSPDPSETASADKVDMFDFNWKDIKKMILKRKDGEIILTKEEREVTTLEEDDEGNTKKVITKKELWGTPDFNVDSYTVDNIATSADVLETTRLIDENPQDSTIYGLDGSVVTTFISSDGKEYAIEIGKQTPTSDGYYCRKKGSTQVYTISNYSGKTLSYGKFDIMDKNLYGTEAISVEDLKTLKFIRSGETVFNSRIGFSMAEWLITEPLEREAELTEISKFMDWLYKFRVTEFVAENVQDLDTYGLDKPKYVFEYTLADKTYTLKLGSLKDDKYYGMMNDDNTVFTVSSSDLNFLDLPLIDLISTFIYIPTIYDVEKLVIEMDGRTDVLLINDSKESGTEPDFRLNGVKMETSEQESLFRKYYQGAIGLTGDRLDLNAEPKGDWFARFTYTRKQADPDKVVTVELIPTEDGYGYYLMKNGKYSGMIMGKRKLDDPGIGIRQAYKNLIEGLEKRE